METLHYDKANFLREFPLLLECSSHVLVLYVCGFVFYIDIDLPVSLSLLEMLLSLFKKIKRKCCILMSLQHCIQFPDLYVS